MQYDKRWHYSLMLLIGGAIGGALSTHFWPSNATAFAATHHSHLVAAEKFELVSPDGAQRGVMQVTPRVQQPSLFTTRREESRRVQSS